MIRAPLMKTAAIPSDSEAPSSSSDEDSLVYIRKTICTQAEGSEYQYHAASQAEEDRRDTGKGWVESSGCDSPLPGGEPESALFWSVAPELRVEETMHSRWGARETEEPAPPLYSSHLGHFDLLSYCAFVRE
ncbi:hypothetical protein H920_00939 [Fukomys damarensis]|uniref:Uncharacterized protein n=1 Tax=Fukomys damarensis TaxID=885580 RepID=A0A091E375_FUKDA|nr:hypothetical protein H920_00939 [Fukomys damarensis]